MKKIIALFLCLALLLALTACSGQSETTETEPEKMQLTPENISNFLNFSINVDDSDMKESGVKKQGFDPWVTKIPWRRTW